MGYPIRKNLSVQKGSTFSKIIRWSASPIVFKAISAINKSAPVQLTVTSHSLVDGWRVAISDVTGMKEINAKNIPPTDDDFYRIKVIDANTIQLPGISSASFNTYQNGGYIRFYTPVDMGGYTARMQVRQKITSAEPVLILTTENGGIILNNGTKTIGLYISAAATTSVAISGGVYDLEMVAPDGTVIPLMSGGFSFSSEVTR